MPWVEDDREPSGWRWIPNHPTYPDPGVISPRAPHGFEHDDGSVYASVDPSELPSFDDVDSRTIVDPGAPDD